MAEKQISPERKAARDAALADDPELDRRMVVYRGVTYEVRAPSIKQVKDAEKHATHDGVKDDAEMTLRLIIESVFSIPGLGRLAVNAVTDSDLPIIVATVLVAGTIIVIANVVVDLLYAVIDPRVRLT